MSQKKRRPATGRPAPHSQPPEEGVGAGGESINPMGQPESGAGECETPCEAPGPGVPITPEEYKRLKEAAASRRQPKSEHAQEDPAAKK